MAKKDTILAHCIARAVIVDGGGEDLSPAVHGDQTQVAAVSRSSGHRTAARVTPKAARVASFVAMWGLALYELERPEISVDEFAEWAQESRATAFRRASEYRELWPDVDLNALARLVRDQISANGSLRKNPARLTSVQLARKSLRFGSQF